MHNPQARPPSSTALSKHPDRRTYPYSPSTHPNHIPTTTPQYHKLTSQSPTLLQMINALPPITLAHLISDESRHHTAHPLLANDCILRFLERDLVVVVYAVEGRWDCWFAREEGCGFRDGHFGDLCSRCWAYWCETRAVRWRDGLLQFRGCCGLRRRRECGVD